MDIQKILALCAGLFLALPYAAANDIDIYNNPNEENVSPPLTVLVLDVNIEPTDIVCPDLLTSIECQVLRDELSLQQILDMLSLNNPIFDLPIVQLAITAANSILGDTLTDIENAPPPLIGPSPQDIRDTLFAALTLQDPDILELTRFEMLRPVLKSIVDGITDARLAVAISHNNTACTFADASGGARQDTVDCSNGGYMLLGFIDLLEDPVQDQLDKITEKIELISAEMGNDVDHSFQGKEVYYEIFQYLTGGDIFNGHIGYLDYGDPDSATNLDADDPPLSWDTTIENGSNNAYESGLDAFPNACDEVNIINVLFSNSADDDDSDDDLNAAFSGANALDGNSSDLTFAEVVTHLEQDGFTHNGQLVNVRSFFFLNGAGTDETALTNLGHAPTSLPDVVNFLGLGEQAANLYKPVLSTSASLGSPTFTPDITTPGQLNDDVFIALFQADADQNPRWSGNIKKLKFADAQSNDFTLNDANGVNAAALDGRIDDDALTFWTDDSNLGGEDVDGRAVELGGAGQNIPGFGGNPQLVNGAGGRTLYYDKDTLGVLSLGNLDADALTATELQSSLDASDAAEALDLLEYVRGYEDVDGVPPPTTTRSWLMGAVLHSQPLAINYGARSSASYDEDNPDVRILVGSTDGFLRMIKNTNSDGTESGAEVWAFMPQEVMEQQKILKENSDIANFPYGVDGEVAVYVEDTSASGAADRIIDTVSSSSDDKVWAFFGLRRGGKAYYGLDISDPDNPDILWRIDTSDPDFSNLGLTFGTPRVGQMLIKPDVPSDAEIKTVVIFAGGYNGGLDASNNPVGKDAEAGSDDVVGTDDAIGNAFYIVDAETGDLIWKAEHTATPTASLANFTNRTFSHPLLDDSFPSTVTALDTNGSGFLDRAYVGDTGGRVWRADFASDDPRDWTMTPIASVGRHDAGGVDELENDRRFFHRPDFVRFTDGNGSYDAVLIGSGNRADPFNKNANNFFYALRDRDITAGKLLADVEVTEANILGHKDDGSATSGEEILDLTDDCLTAGAASCPTDTELASGWRVGMDQSGEKILSVPFTVSRGIFFTTFVPPDPDSSICTPLEGASRVFGLNLSNASALGEPGFNDGSGGSRAQSLKSAGYAGQTIFLESGKLLGSDLAEIDTDPLDPPATYWRDRLGDEDQAIPQPAP